MRGFLGALGSFSFFSRLRFFVLLSAAGALASLEAGMMLCPMPLAMLPVEVTASMAALAVAATLGGSLRLSSSPSSPARIEDVCCMYFWRRSLRPVWTWVRPCCRLVRDMMTW